MTADRQRQRLAATARHVRQCRREALVVIALWVLGFASTAVILVGWGYVPVDERPAVPPLVWGMPAWVAWGLFVPWFVQIAAVWWFALCVLKDDEPLDGHDPTTAGKRS